MATNANFKFPGYLKRMLSSTINDAERTAFKKCMISAVSEAERMKTRKFSDPASGQKPNRKETNSGE